MLYICCRSSNGQYISVDKFTTFLNQEQRDPRLNEVLFPYYDVKKANALIRQFEPIKKLADDGLYSDHRVRIICSLCLTDSASLHSAEQAATCSSSGDMILIPGLLSVTVWQRVAIVQEI